MNTKGKGLNHELGEANCNFKHGMTINRRHSRIYSSWANMVQRCTNRTNQDWKYYGGRGIAICVGLRSSVSNLFNVIGHPPRGKTLNRIDNNRHYSCGRCVECMNRYWSLNVEWADHKKQARNRNTKKITFNGRTLGMSEWAEVLGIKRRTIKGRIDRGKTDPSEILAPPDTRWTN